MANPAQRSRRLVDRVVAPYVNGLAGHVARVQDSILDLHARVGWIEDQLRELPAREQRITATVEELAERARGERQQNELDRRADRDADRELYRRMLREIYERADEQRRRLYQLRASAEYEIAFSEEEPLVSFVVPTYDRWELLRDRSLPSILNQDYENLEVIVSGDQSPPETERVVRELGDPRLRFINRSVRGPYPEDAEKRWLMSGTPPLNDGVAAARGRWIAILGDDDEVTPRHTASLLAAARERRLEHCYGRLEICFADGGEFDWESKFPPAYGFYTLQLAIYHAGLRFFQFEPADVLYDEPNDWSLARRMVAAGVRFGMTDDLVAYKHEDRPSPPQLVARKRKEAKAAKRAGSPTKPAKFADPEPES